MVLMNLFAGQESITHIYIYRENRLLDTAGEVNGGMN